MSAIDHVVLAWPTHLAAVEGGDGPPTSWIQIARTGAFVSKRYGKFSITKDDLSTMLYNFAHITPKAPTLLPIDYDHLSMAPKAVGDGAAAGWIQQLELRENGEALYAHVRWTPEAARRIADREYQYTSPSFVKDHVHKDGTKIGTTLLAAAITNHPFLEGMAAITLSDDDAFDIARREVIVATLHLADVGQVVTIKATPDLGAFTVAEVVGVGDDAFVGLTDATGERLPGWYRVTDLGPAAADAPAATLPAAGTTTSPGASGVLRPTPGPAGKPAPGTPGSVNVSVTPGTPDPTAATPDAHAAAASAHAHAASAHAGAINQQPRGFAMSQTFTLSVNDQQVTVTAEQLEAAGIKVVPEGQITVPPGEVETLKGQVTNLSAQVTMLATQAETSARQAVVTELATTLARLSKGGFITKPTRDWATKHFATAVDLTQFREWAATQNAPVIHLEQEHGHGQNVPETPTQPADQLLTLAQARSAEQHISLSAAVIQISREDPAMAEAYREMYGDTTA